MFIKFKEPYNEALHYEIQKFLITEIPTHLTDFRLKKNEVRKLLFAKNRINRLVMYFKTYPIKGISYDTEICVGIECQQKS